MARMYPESLPESESGAEKRLYLAFQEQLPDEYIVMHGVPWMDPDTNRHHHEGEIDFLIIHPKLGIVLMEVKGGRIEVRDGDWYSIDRYDVSHQMKRSPMEQARRSMRAIDRQIANTATTRVYQNEYRYQTCVAFPDISTRDLQLGTDTPKELVFDDRDTYAVEVALQRIAGVLPPKRQLSSKSIQALVSLLKPVVKIDQLGYAAQLDRSAREIETLTDQQYEILLNLRHHNQLAIAGCAGSGKTMLALKRAKFLAQNGQRVLLTCFNRPLSDWLASTVANDPSFPDEFIRVQNFDQLAHTLMSDTIAGAPAMPRNGNLTHYFAETLPEAFFDAIESGDIEQRFDAIIVDEGQDFNELRWYCLAPMLEDPDHDIFYVFFDSEQGIYERSTTLPVRISDTVLTRNCRNTAPIHETLIGYYPGDMPPLSSNIDGLTPEIIPAEPDGYPRALGQAFDSVFNKQGIPTSEAVVLTFAREGISKLEEGQRIGKSLLTWEQPTHQNQVMISTVQRFKGLERSIVFLVIELDHHEEQRQHPLLYVGISRAKQHLIVIGHLPEPIERVIPEDPLMEPEPDLFIEDPVIEEEFAVDEPVIDPEQVPEVDVEISDPVPDSAEPEGEDPVATDPDIEHPEPIEPHPTVDDVDHEIAASPPQQAATPMPAPEQWPVSPPSSRPGGPRPQHPERSLTVPPPQYLQTQTGRILPGSDHERIVAALAYLVWFVVPIGLLMTHGESRFARRHAWQGIIFGGASVAYLAVYVIFWLGMFSISPALACLAIFGAFVPFALGLYYATRIYTRSQSHFLILSDLTRTLIRDV